MERDVPLLQVIGFSWNSMVLQWRAYFIESPLMNSGVSSDILHKHNTPSQMTQLTGYC